MSEIQPVSDFVRSAVEAPARTVEKKQRDLPKPNQSEAATFNVTDDMPLSIYDEGLRNPLLMTEWNEMEVLWKTDLVQSRDKISAVDRWIRDDLESTGFKLTVGAYKEYLQMIKKNINFSPNKTGIETLDQMFHYLKHISHRKNK